MAIIDGKYTRALSRCSLLPMKKYSNAPFASVRGREMGEDEGLRPVRGIDKPMGQFFNAASCTIVS